MNDTITPNSILDDNPISFASEWVDATRSRLLSSPEAARLGVLALASLLANDPALRERARNGILAILADRRQVSLYSDTGIFPATGFFTESFRRIAESILPGANDGATLRDAVSEIFDRHEDAEWVLNAGPEAWVTLVKAFRFDEIADDARFASTLRSTREQMLESLRILSYHIAAIGLEDEVLRIEPNLEKFASPFLAQNVETLAYLDAYARWLDAPDDAPVHDERHLRVLLHQCEGVAAGIRKRAARNGTSFHLTFLLVRLEQSIARTGALLDLFATLRDLRGTPELGDRILEKTGALAVELICAECRKNNLGEYFRQTLRLMSLRITENAGNTGEHYITETREEWFAMLRAGIGAGFIIAFMALLKIFLGAGEMAPIPRIIVYGLDYGLGFVLIHILHFTVATKQPAMTANAIAAAIGSGSGKNRDLTGLVTIIRRTARTQFAAVAGNLLLVLPTSALLVYALRAATGSREILADKADYLLHSAHPWHTALVFYSAIAGAFLFLAGIIAGYFDNLCAYARIPERMARTRWLARLLGAERLRSVSKYVGENLGAIVGNFTFGFMLAGGWGIGVLFGLPVDIRHITFSSANVLFAVTSKDFTTAPEIWIPPAIGVVLIGAINLAVSFALALFVALRSRGVTPDIPGLLRRVAADFARNPKSYFLPPRPGKNKEPDGTPPAPRTAS